MSEQPKPDWRTGQYYPSKKSCVICGSKEMIGEEPRFGYTVCEQHSKLTPIQISQQRTH